MGDDIAVKGRMGPVVAVRELDETGRLEAAVDVGEVVVIIQTTAHVVVAVIIIAPGNVFEVALQAAVGFHVIRIAPVRVAEVDVALLKAVKVIEKLLA